MSLRLETDGPLVTLLIDRAAKRNAFDLAMWQAMPDLLDQTTANPEARLLVIRAADGGAFCAGADIAELLANKDDLDWRATSQVAINRVQRELTRLALPTLAFIEGDCVGGGCGIALACDLRIATPAARLGITPAKLGLIYPLHDIKLLVDLVGPGQARRMLFTGELLDATEALRIGLVERIAQTPEETITMLLAASPTSIHQIKRFIRRVLDGQLDDDDATRRKFAAAFEGEDFAEGTRAFVEKRAPRFVR